MQAHAQPTCSLQIHKRACTCANKQVARSRKLRADADAAIAAALAKGGRSGGGAFGFLSSLCNPCFPGRSPNASGSHPVPSEAADVALSSKSKLVSGGLTGQSRYLDDNDRIIEPTKPQNEAAEHDSLPFSAIRKDNFSSAGNLQSGPDFIPSYAGSSTAKYAVNSDLQFIRARS